MFLEEFDPSRTAVIDPNMLNAPIADFPDVTVSCFSEALFHKVLEYMDAEILTYIHPATGRQPVYEVRYRGERFAFYLSLVGEPGCIMEYENLLAMGSRCLILFGNCGVLDRNIEDCGIIIPTKAIRDEGCSYHYAPPGDMLDVNHKYAGLFKSVLEERGYSYVEGITWTTDAVFRETRNKVERRKTQGAICVEMECAGMQALCDFRNTEFFQFFYAGDNLDHSQWQPRSVSGNSRLDDKTRIALLAFELGLKVKQSKEGNQ